MALSIASGEVQAKGRDPNLIPDLKHPPRASLPSRRVIPRRCPPLGRPEGVPLLRGRHCGLELANGLVLILGLRLGHILRLFINYRTQAKASMHLEIN